MDQFGRKGGLEFSRQCQVFARIGLQRSGMSRTGKPAFGIVEIGALLVAAAIAVTMIIGKPADELPPIAQFDANTQYLGVGAGQSTDQSELPQYFRDGYYFGVLVRSNDSQYFYRVGYNSLQTAETLAMASCQNSTEPAPTCAVVGRLVPLGYEEKPGRTLSAPAAAELRGLWGKGEAQAMAVSGDGSYGMGWGYRSTKEAIGRALQECQLYQQQSHPFPKDAAKAPCELIYVSR